MMSSLKLFSILYYLTQIDSKLLCVCSVIVHRGSQSVVRTSVTHSAAPCMPLFCSYHILTSSVIYYWTDARQLVKHKIYGYDFHEQFLSYWFPFHPLLIYILQLEVTLLPTCSSLCASVHVLGVWTGVLSLWFSHWSKSKWVLHCCQDQSF